MILYQFGPHTSSGNSAMHDIPNPHGIHIHLTCTHAVYIAALRVGWVSGGRIYIPPFWHFSKAA